MEKLIHVLPDEQQRVIYAIYFKQLTIGQTAALEGCSINTIKSRLFYARRTLRDAILNEEKKTGDKFCLPAATLALASMMALPQVGFTLAPDTAAQIFSVVMTALGIYGVGGDGVHFYTTVEEKEEGSGIAGFFARSYLIKFKPAVCLAAVLVLICGVLGTLILRRTTFAAAAVGNDLAAEATTIADDIGKMSEIVLPQAAADSVILDGVSYRYTCSDAGATIIEAVIDPDASLTAWTLPEMLDGQPLVALTAPTIENSEGVKSVRVPPTFTYTPTEEAPHAFALMPDREEIGGSYGSETLCCSRGVLYSADMSTLLIYPAAKPDEQYNVLGKTKVLAPHSIAGRALKEIGLPEGLVEIGAWCFVRAESLHTLKIPSTVTTLGENALGSSALQNIYVIKGNGNFYSVSGSLYNYEKTELIRYAAGQEKNAFSTRSGTESIAAYAFYGADQLKQITLGADVGRLDEHALIGMKNLTDLTLVGEELSLEEIPLDDLPSALNVHTSTKDQ
ncbi:MAG: leucine-rich repeat protein [Clostridia bacterium]|nr:leucine-rich repeat protein [Clostridia bacterium]